MSNEIKNDEVIEKVQTTEEGTMAPAEVKNEKVKATAKKVGKILLAGLALGVAFCLGKKSGRRAAEADCYDDDVIYYDDSDSEDTEE